MNLSLDTAREDIILSIQHIAHLVGYENLTLELDERPNKYVVRIYTRGKAHPCDDCAYIHNKDMELAEFARRVWNKTMEVLL